MKTDSPDFHPIKATECDSGSLWPGGGEEEEAFYHPGKRKTKEGKEREETRNKIQDDMKRGKEQDGQ